MPPVSVPRLVADGWRVVTSDLERADCLFNLSTTTGPEALIAAVTRNESPISGLVLSHAHDIESGLLDTTAESFDLHVAVNGRISDIGLLPLPVTCVTVRRGAIAGATGNTRC